MATGSWFPELKEKDWVSCEQNGSFWMIRNEVCDFYFNSLQSCRAVEEFLGGLILHSKLVCGGQVQRQLFQNRHLFPTASKLRKAIEESWQTVMKCFVAALIDLMYPDCISSQWLTIHQHSHPRSNHLALTYPMVHHCTNTKDVQGTHTFQLP